MITWPPRGTTNTSRLLGSGNGWCPKNAARCIHFIRPKIVMEILCKLWTGLIVDQVTRTLQHHGSLSTFYPPARYGYCKSTTFEYLEIGLGWTQDTFCWDMSKAINYFQVYDYSLVALELKFLSDLLTVTITALPSSAPSMRRAAYCVGPTVTVSSSLPAPPKSDDSFYPAHSICYADDLQFFAVSLRGLRFTAHLVSCSWWPLTSLWPPRNSALFIPQRSVSPLRRPRFFCHSCRGMTS